LTNGTRFSEMTGGAPADLNSDPGGAFSCFGGKITGRTIEALPGKRLVQAWRAESWDPGIYSVVRFELSQNGETTRLTLDQHGFPDGEGGHLEQGWKAMYWEPLRKLLG